MGRLRLSAFRSRVDFIEKKPAITISLVDEEKAQQEVYTEHVEVVQEIHEYPIVHQRTAAEDLPFIASTEVTKQNGQEGRRLWIVVDNIVLDVTDYQQKHPGGRQIIAGFGGQDCSWQVRCRPQYAACIPS
ncbi:hypothetical protein LTR56_004733 [Elasticomyces elasticus]|nr:hypothetical protein LTR56_004733 [Elasticomyces elasticus]KAK3665588.1 hypothetical protein LTR22_003528 [Elasticomyces elasticus]KAK4930374.1 hypothetical protein LTR49_003115 [Elasticomyces elasticus]KAK5768899.1 hypothetical protein LTS12_000959 [Elasticomyces elasticus]